MINLQQNTKLLPFNILNLENDTNKERVNTKSLINQLWSSYIVKFCNLRRRNVLQPQATV